jgi:hypothetical protein
MNQADFFTQFGFYNPLPVRNGAIPQPIPHTQNKPAEGRYADHP